MLFLAVEHLQQLVGQIGADGKRQRDDAAGNARAAEKAAAEAAEHAAEHRTLGLLLGGVGALLRADSARRPARELRTATGAAASSPDKTKARNMNHPPCRFGGKLCFDLNGVN